MRTLRQILVVAPLVVTLVALSPGAAVAQSVGPTGKPYLGPGSEGRHVMEWQDDLNTWLQEARPEQGVLTEDGVYGPTTEAATRDFQSTRGIAVDGIVGPNTRAEMHEYLAGQGVEDPPLAPGDEGVEVVEWQGELNLWTDTDPGIDPLALDGIYGPRTEALTSQFQEARGIQVDGVVGPVTRNEQHRFVLGTYFEAPPDGGARILGRGDIGPAVAEWQDRLNDWLQVARTEQGRLAVDGIFGPLTEAATMDFQDERGITVDGLVGPETRAEMEEFQSSDV